MKESQLEAKVVKHCRDRGILCYKFSSPAHRGVPDRLLIKDGKVLFLELKAEGKRPTRLQVREMQLLWYAGVQSEWVDTYQRAVEVIDDAFVTVNIGSLL